MEKITMDYLPAPIRERLLSGTLPESTLTEEDKHRCPLCGGCGVILFRDEEGTERGKRCICAIKAANERRIARSGLSSMVKALTFESWQAVEPWQKHLRELCESYAHNPEGWLVLSGRPGTGKTHLCTAVCSELMQQGREVRYLLWRDFATRAKSLTTDADAYEELLKPLKATPVLYVDDLFKTGRGQPPTAGDVNLAFELLNDRYNDPSLITILSSELTINAMVRIDEALASRIAERSRGHYADLTGRANWRLRQ